MLTISSYPANIYLFKVNNRNIRKMFGICSMLTIKTPERRQWPRWRCSGVFIVNFEHIPHLFLVFILVYSTFVQKISTNGNHFKRKTVYQWSLLPRNCDWFSCLNVHIITTAIIIYTLLMPVDARNLRYTPSLDIGSFNDKLIDLVHSLRDNSSTHKD